jgi:hypothetical protein
MKVISVILLVCATAFSAIAGQVMMKGKVVDHIDGKPKAVDITFVDPNGKKIKILSNILTGEYRQLLDGGTNYDVTVMAGDVFRETFSISTRSSDSSYVEQDELIKVKSLMPGRELQRYSAFSGSNLTPDATKNIRMLNKMMRFNRGLTIDLAVADEAKKAAVEANVNKLKYVADRINVVVKPEAGNDIVYFVNNNKDLFKD